MILTLVVIGGKAIKHFSDYGCLGRMSIAGEGVDLVPVPANSCPKLPSEISNQAQNHTLSVENDKACWEMLFANGGNSDYYPNCIMSDPSFQLGVILSFSVPFYVIRVRRIANYKANAFAQAKRNFLQDLSNSNGDPSLSDNFETLAHRLGEVSPRDVAERNCAYQDGVESAEREYSEMAVNVERDATELDLNSLKIADILSRLKYLAPRHQTSAEVHNMMDRLTHLLESDREACVPDTGSFDSGVANVFDAEESVIEKCELGSLNSLHDGALSCDHAFKDIAPEGMMEDTIQSSSIASNDPIVKSMSEALPGDNIEGRAAEMDTEDIARAIGVGGEVSGVDMMSSMAAMVFPFVNFMFMMNIFENVLHSAVTSVMHALNAGLKETMQALEKLSKQEALQFNSTINIIESK
eukprot:Nk52_evm1s87 gene=Nk52_evmTU1s87